MEIKSAMGNAVLGIRRGMEGLERNAAQVASAEQMRGEASPLEPLVDSLSNQRQVEASVKVLRAVDEALGSLFDEKA